MESNILSMSWKFSFQMKVVEQVKVPRESRGQDVAALKAAATAVRDEINIFQARNNSNFSKEPASKKSLEIFEKNKMKLKEMEDKIMLYSPSFILQVSVNKTVESKLLNCCLPSRRPTTRSMFTPSTSHHIMTWRL